jgi:thioredoxin 1
VPLKNPERKRHIKGVNLPVDHRGKAVISMANVAQVNEKDFDDEVLKEELPVLVDFWAPWCYPCQMMGPELEKLSGHLTGRLKVVKLNTDENPKISRDYAVSAIPTLILFKGGQVAERLTGFTRAEELQTKLSAHIQK